VNRVLRRESFRAMGTVCSVAVSAESRDVADARAALAAARREIAACERALSRFDPGSELSRLNREAGSWVEVDARLVEALAAALQARAETGGRFDPTILPALAAAGYDRSFELLTGRASVPLAGWHPGARVDVDRGRRRARVEHGAAVDLGGIGKGFASTRALRAMREAWPAMDGALVDLGGDIGVWGGAPEGGPWRVDIADPRREHRVAGTLELAGGGVATSGRDTRRFGPGNRLHHLIDPATGLPAVAGPLSVTVVAPSATEAEAHATALAVTDVALARARFASHPDLAAFLIPELGEPVTIGRLPLVPERRFVITMQGGRFQ
jgi:thiamine biosynthesis lipoprotein